MSSRLPFGDFLLIAEAVLGSSAEHLSRTVLLPGAESALAAPFATFDGVDFYPDPAERAAICCSRIIRNHPFPDGNKRVAYECMREMLERDGLPWPRPSEDAQEIGDMVEGLAAREVSEAEFVAWVKKRTEG
ncbi:MAG TPA: Fic family protein [Solirubrobacterales bacterium]|nr:Fic family protein [Solirubrobacterales bacterium]